MTEIRDSAAEIARLDESSDESEAEECCLEQLSDSEPEEDGNCPSSRRSSLASLGFRAKKHLVGRIVKNKKSLKPLIGRRASKALNAFDMLIKYHVKPESEAKRLIGAIIKSIGKVGCVLKQGNLTELQVTNAQLVRDQFRRIALTFLTFCNTPHSYNPAYLDELMSTCQATLRRSLAKDLSEKSINRIDDVFSSLRSRSLMDSVFNSNATASHKKVLGVLSGHLQDVLNASRSAKS